MHSRFVENHPIRILEDGPLISEGVLSHRCSSLELDGAMSPVPLLGTGRWGRGGGGEDDGTLARVAWVVVGGLDGCLDPAATGPYGGSRTEKEENIARRKTEDRLGHRHTHGEEHQRATVRIHP
jgi:hypothetical protein